MKKYLHLLLIPQLLLVACSDPNEIIDTPINTDPAVTLNNPISNFVWEAMNEFYYWQEDVTNLADSKKNIQDDYFNYLNGYTDPEELFESLIFDKGNTDRFSWYIEDYEVQNDIFRGVSDSFGFDFGLVSLCDNCDDVIGFISYVVADSPASDAGLKRGDLFYRFNGTVLTKNNFEVVNGFYSDNNISMGFATIDDGVVVPNDKEVNLALRVVMDNPIFYSEIITNDQGKKIGYLVYNAFNYTYHGELNDVFAEFKSNNIDELILDLRYNGGGRGLTTSFLASMIYGNASEEDVFAKVIFNSKYADENYYYPFYNEASIYNKEGEYSGQELPINRLSNLDKLYVITNGDTASASELIINGLSPYMSVIKVGTTTYGKNVGSRTIYDSPDFSFNGVNSNHTIALQPISSKAFNKLDESDYTQGFVPDYEVIDYVGQMKDFGDREEPLLKATLDIISGNFAKISELKEPKIATEVLFNSIDKKPFSKELLIELF